MSDEKWEDLGCLPNGAHLFRKPNTAGGHTYYSDEIGGGVKVWDTCLISESTLLTAIICEHYRKYMESNQKPNPKTTSDMAIEQAAATGGSFIQDGILPNVSGSMSLNHSIPVSGVYKP